MSEINGKVMALYEITNGYIGDVAVTAFAWAGDKEEALVLARQEFEKQAKYISQFVGGKWTQVERHTPYPPAYWTDLKIRLLFQDYARPFCTVPTEGGWEEHVD